MVRCGLCLKTFNGLANLEQTEESDLLNKVEGKESSPEHKSSYPNAKTESENAHSLSWKDEDDFYIDDNFDLRQLEESFSDEPLRKNPESNSGQPPSATAPNLKGKSSLSPDPLLATAETEKQPSQNIAANTKAAASIKPTASKKNHSFVQYQDDDKLSLDAEEMALWRPESSALIAEGITGQGKESLPKAKPPRPFQWLWYMGSALALLLLGIQLLYFNSSVIDHKSSLWLLTKPLCGTLDCPLSTTTKDIKKITSTDLIVRTHPRVANALFVDAVINNNADFSQPFPNLTLVFEDLQGQVVAKRTFAPAEYLQGELAGAAMMPIQQPIKLELEIIDPGRDAVSFRLYASD